MIVTRMTRGGRGKFCSEQSVREREREEKFGWEKGEGEISVSKRKELYLLSVFRSCTITAVCTMTPKEVSIMVHGKIRTRICVTRQENASYPALNLPYLILNEAVRIFYHWPYFNKRVTSALNPDIKSKQTLGDRERKCPEQWGREIRDRFCWYHEQQRRNGSGKNLSDCVAQSSEVGRLTSQEQCVWLRCGVLILERGRKRERERR